MSGATDRVNDHLNDDNTNPSQAAKGGTFNGQLKGLQSQIASNTKTFPTKTLVQKIATRENLRLAFKSVKRNKGAPGVDLISIQEVDNNLDNIIDKTIALLINGEYKPLPVRRHDIPKPDGKTRRLGIPTVIDRMVQQAIVQSLSPLFDPTFSNLSFGFRPKRSAKDALLKARKFVAEGRKWVVDIDLEQCFDNVQHDKLMSLLAKRIQDKPLLLLIRRFLTAGVMHNGVRTESVRGTPQGGPLSPLLSNVLLHELDLELERRNHKFCRYADDCNIYVRSKAAAERVMKSITTWVESRLKLKVNKTKSAAAKVSARTFLGFTLYNDSSIAISKKSLERFKDAVRKITKRNRGISLDDMIIELNRLIRGWFHYYKWASFKTIFRQLDGWLRRRLRCFRLKQRKRKYSTKTFLQSLGIDRHSSWNLACSDKGWWRKALNPIIHTALPDAWFDRKGLFNLQQAFVTHQAETAVCDIARTVV